MYFDFKKAEHKQTKIERDFSIEIEFKVKLKKAVDDYV